MWQVMICMTYWAGMCAHWAYGQTAETKELCVKEIAVVLKNSGRKPDLIYCTERKVSQ